MNLSRNSKTAAALIGLLAAFFLAGCSGVPTASEQDARRNLKSVTTAYRPSGARPAMPELATNSTLGDFMRYAMLNQPRVEAAYFDWAAAVESITTARSLPDPQLTFQTDIQNIITSLMPGLQMNFPGPGKLRAGAEMASAESQSKYFTFQSTVLETAYNLKRAYYQLFFLEEKTGTDRQTLRLLADLEKDARVQNEVGKVTLQDVLRAQIEQDRLVNDITNLEDSRHALIAQFKAALGLAAAEPDPPVPANFESTPLDTNSEQWLAAALALNPRLKAMEADVRRAEAAIALAQKSRVPDTSLGLMADAWTSPTLYRPQASITLPLWRDKLAAQLAESQAGRRAAQARLSAEQISLAVDFAQDAFGLREAERNLALLRERLLPKAGQALSIARTAYLSGQVDFFNLMDSERTLLNFQLEEVDQRAQRELLLAELSLMILGQPPSGAPLLPSAGQ